MKEREDLQEALDKLSNWADRWGMEFNVSKCKVMHVGHNNETHTYTMKSQQLTETEEERDIGVMVSRHLKPSALCIMWPHFPFSPIPFSFQFSQRGCGWRQCSKFNLQRDFFAFHARITLSSF